MKGWHCRLPAPNNMLSALIKEMATCTCTQKCPFPRRATNNDPSVSKTMFHQGFRAESRQMRPRTTSPPPHSVPKFHWWAAHFCSGNHLPLRDWFVYSPAQDNKVTVVFIYIKKKEVNLVCKEGIWESHACSASGQPAVLTRLCLVVCSFGYFWNIYIQFVEGWDSGLREIFWDLADIQKGKLVSNTKLCLTVGKDRISRLWDWKSKGSITSCLFLLSLSILPKS